MYRFLMGLLVVIGFQATAQATIDVSCYLGDCMSEGWHAYDSSNGQSTVVECAGFDCLNEGWVTKINNREINYTVCKLDGCFEDGWTVYDSNTGRILSESTCANGFTGGRCLEFGWSTFVPNQGTFQTRCINRDCLGSGWTATIPGFNPQQARCKTGGCFSTGWRLFR